MNLKNSYLLKKLLKKTKKTCKNFSIYNAFLFLKKRKTPGDIISYLCTKNIEDMIYSSWDIEYERLKLVIMGHFFPFYPHPLPPSPILLKTPNN